MELSLGWKILGLILISWAARTSFAQISNCSFPAQTVTAYANFNTTITSPNYPFYYGNNLECAWLITVDSSLSFGGYIVKVIFNDFSLEQSSPCNDVLTFYDGYAVSTVLGSYCGTAHSEVIYSTGEKLYVKFHTDFLHSVKGFNFSFSAVKEEEASGICRPWDGGNTVQRLNGTSGTFFSPGYPVPFPENGRCIWTITVPSGKRVKLKFEDLDLVTSNTSCNQQNVIGMGSVQIRDGHDQESRELAFHCGYQSSFSGIPEVYSTGRYMWVDFFSNSPKGWEGRKGFKARYEAVDFGPSSRELCFNENVYKNDLKLNGSSGTLQSPERGYYPPGSSCDWLITVPDGKIIKLSFDRFDLEPTFGSTCTADYVEVFDGRNSNSKSKGRFCGDIIPGDIHSSNRYMWVRFRSDTAKSDYNGFRATYTAEDKQDKQDKPSSTSSSALIVGIVVGVIVFIAIICSIVCFIKHKKKPSGPAVATIPMSTATATESHITQPEVNPYPSAPMG